MTARMGFVVMLLVCAVAAVAQQTSERTLDRTEAPVLDLPQYAAPEAPAAGDAAAEEKLRQVREQMAAEVPQTPAARADTAGEPSMSRSTLQSFAALCLVLALITAMAYAWRRFGRRVPLLAGAGLGQVAGKVYLSPRVSLHYVRTGGKMLVIGVMPNAMALIAEFEEEAFPQPSAPVPPAPAAAPRTAQAESFLQELQANLREQEKPIPAVPPADEAELDALRRDVLRLQQFLEGRTRGSRE